MMDALCVEKVTMNFGGIQALNSVTLTVKAGERRVIIGPNGAGKTTLFNVIAGQLSPSMGGISIFGEDVTSWPPHRRVKLGIARTFQITNLFPDLSLLENIILGMQSLLRTKWIFYKPLKRYKKNLERSESLLRDWGLWQRRYQLVRNLSHGEQRQAEIVLALAVSPRILLLDEPTQGLSPAETLEVTDMIKKLDSSITLLLIEHDMDVAFRLAENITVLHYGCLHAEGTPEHIRQNPKVKEIYLGTDKPHAEHK